MALASSVSSIGSTSFSNFSFLTGSGGFICSSVGVSLKWWYYGEKKQDIGRARRRRKLARTQINKYEVHTTFEGGDVLGCGCTDGGGV
jgi:hypothetical protein